MFTATLFQVIHTFLLCLAFHPLSLSLSVSHANVADSSRSYHCWAASHPPWLASWWKIMSATKECTGGDRNECIHLPNLSLIQAPGEFKCWKMQGLSSLLSLQGALVYTVVNMQGDEGLCFLGLVLQHLSEELCHWKKKWMRLKVQLCITIQSKPNKNPKRLCWTTAYTRAFQ